MSSILCVFLAVLFFCGPCYAQEISNVQAPSATNAKSLIKLEDSTPVMLRTRQDLSSATAKIGDRISFRVVKDIRIADLVVISRDADAWGFVTAVQPKSRKGRPGKLDIVIQSVQMLTGDNASLRAKQHAEGKGRDVGTAADIPKAAITSFGELVPYVLFSMLEKGKDAYLATGTASIAYLNGDVILDRLALERVQPHLAEDKGPASATVFRAESGKRFQLPVYCGRVNLAKLPHSAYLKIQLPPGKYYFHSSDKQVVEVLLEEGKELYLQTQLVVVRKGGFKGHLVRVDNAVGEEEVAKLNELRGKDVRKVSDANLADLKAIPPYE